MPGTGALSLVNGQAAKKQAAKNAKAIAQYKELRKQRLADERANAPVAKTNAKTTNPPRMVSAPNGDTYIVHREYIGEVTATSGTPSSFSLTQYAVNAGAPGTFPWLSTIASRWESHRFERLDFEYETEAQSTLGGSVILSLNYDASSAAPVSKQAAMAIRRSVRTAPWNPVKHVSMKEDLSKQKTYFVRPGAVPTNSDIKMYDTGVLNVITQGVTTASAVCGELYVSYAVRLMTPVYESDPSGVATAEATGTTSQSQSAIFGIAGGGVGYDGTLTLSCPLNVMTVTGLVIGQRYACSIWINGTVMSAYSLTFTSGMTQSTNVSAVNGAATSVVGLATAVATSQTAVLTFAITATTVAETNFVISQIPASAGF